MAEKLFDAQVNYGWGLSLNMTGKAPAVAKRIFDTYADALAYANDVNDSAIDGLVLTVVADTNAALNGVYFVQQAATKAIEADEEQGIEAVEAKPAILAKLSSAQDNESSAEAVLEALNTYKATNDAIVSGHTAALAILNGGADVEGSLAKVAKDAADAVAAEKGLREAAEKAITDRLDVIEGEAEGSVKKALADAKTYADNKVAALDAEVSSTDGTHVTVKVTEVDGVITAVNVTESDIASAQALADEVAARQTAISGISEVIGEVAEGKTVVGMINDAQNAAAAAATKIADKATGHVTVSVAQDETTGALTYTIAENDIASAQALADAVANLESGKTVSLAAVDEAEAGYLKTYVLSQGGAEVGKINIPKDLVVTKGEIVVKDNEKYLRLTIANQDAPVDIAVKDLVDVYTGSDYITVGDDNKISVKFADLDAALVAEGTEVQKAIAAVASDLATEAATREEEDGKLSKAITDEAAKAREEEGKLATAISAETSARETAIGVVNGLISDEVDERKEAINGVNAAISAETSAREAAISGVSKEVADEVAAREAAVKAMKLEEISGFIVKIKQENGVVSAQAAETAPANKIAVADAENKFTGTDVEAVLAELDGKINNVSSAAIGVEAGNAIEITPNGTLQKIAVKLSSEAGNALTIDTKGLYLSNIIDCGTF